ncbi:MAG: OmpA family protein [Lentisphaeria bacterium]|nr:OmpA family protein [Lentisphaeria bacterium]
MKKIAYFCGLSATFILVGCKSDPKLSQSDISDYNPVEIVEETQTVSSGGTQSSTTGFSIDNTDQKPFTIPEDDGWKQVGTEADTDQGETVVIEKHLGTIYFSYDKSTLKPTETAKLDKWYEEIKVGKKAIVVEGHCDIRGSEEYNRSLGERRAITVKEYFENLGLNGDRVQTISYGEDKPAREGDVDSAHQYNRRAEVMIVKVK